MPSQMDILVGVAAIFVIIQACRCLHWLYAMRRNHKQKLTAFGNTHINIVTRKKR